MPSYRHRPLAWMGVSCAHRRSRPLARQPRTGPRRLTISRIETPPRIDGLVDDACWHGRGARLRLFPVRPGQRREGLRGDLRLGRLRPGLPLFRLPDEGLPAGQDLGRADAAQRVRKQRFDHPHPGRLQRQADEHHLRPQPQGRPEEFRRDDLEVRSGHAGGRLERRDGHPLQVPALLRPNKLRSGASISKGTSTGSTKPTTGPTSTATCPSSSRPESSAASPASGPAITSSSSPTPASGRPSGKGETDTKAAVGLDVKWGIKPNLYLDVTASPDFSEVESDPFIYQLSPYENYLQENRPFFTEGSRYFNLSSGDEYHDGGLSLFYSRRIRNPEVRGQDLRQDGRVRLRHPRRAQQGRRRGETPRLLLRRRPRPEGHLQELPGRGLLRRDPRPGADRNQNVAVDYNFNFKDFYYIRGMSAFTFNEGAPPTRQRHPPAPVPEGAGRRPADHVGLPEDRGQRRHPDGLHRPDRRPVLRPHDRLRLALQQGPLQALQHRHRRPRPPGFPRQRDRRQHGGVRLARNSSTGSRSTAASSSARASTRSSTTTDDARLDAGLHQDLRRQPRLQLGARRLPEGDQRSRAAGRSAASTTRNSPPSSPAPRRASRASWSCGRGATSNGRSRATGSARRSTAPARRPSTGSPTRRPSTTRSPAASSSTPGSSGRPGRTSTASISSSGTTSGPGTSSSSRSRRASGTSSSAGWAATPSP